MENYKNPADIGRNMADTWYGELRFTSNPLDTRPNPDLVGLEDESDRLKLHTVSQAYHFHHQIEPRAAGGGHSLRAGQGSAYWLGATVV